MRPVDVSEIRLTNLHLLIKMAGTANAVAERADTNPVYLSQLVRRSADSGTGRVRTMGSALARRIESAFNKPHGWMDYPHADAASELVAQEPAAAYIAWPFRRVSASEWEKLTPEQQAVVEGVVQGLLLETAARPQEQSETA